MDRINGADTIDIGGGRRGFRDENLAAGAAGTEVTALWLNMLQEEILKVIVEAGFVPSAGDWTQLWQALQALGLAPDRSRRWLGVNSMTLSSAPGAPSAGDAYLIPVGATGIWAGSVGNIAIWSGASWIYITPTDGHGISLPDGRIFERVAGTYAEKVALDAQSGKWKYAAAGGTANALTANLTPAPASIAAGMAIVLLILADNTAAATLNLNGLGALPILTASGAALMPGDLPAGAMVHLICSGSSWRLSPASVQRGKIEMFGAAGTFSWVCPAGVYRVKVTATGAGGGGSRSTASQSGSSGGAGGTAIGFVSVTPGTTYTVIVGLGGSAGNYGGQEYGLNGGSSSAFGFSGNGGSGASLLNNGNGGNASGGQLNMRGGDGQDSSPGSYTISTNGGASYWGGGLSSGSGNGSKAVTPGTGGCSSYNGQALAGGDGADGIVVLEY